METFAVFLYSLIPFITSAAYYPQVRRLMKSSPEEIQSISLLAWGTWLFCSIAGLLYGIYHLRDLLFCILAGLSVFWESSVVLITLYKRRFRQSRPSGS